jgi:putative hydrolase of the HAD superfamily
MPEILTSSTLAVFFDLVGTLIRATRPIGDQYADWARRHGAAAADSERMGAAFRRAMREAPAMAFPGESLEAVARGEREWWRTLVGTVVSDCGLERDLGGERFEAFFRDLYGHFTTAEAWEIFPDALLTLARLRDSGRVVGLITNFDTRVYPVLDAVNLTDVLDSVTIPALAGAAKPDPAIFAHALRAHGIEPGLAVFVGDEPGDDYAGASAAGMRPVLIDREGKYEEEGYRRIQSLGELSL